MESDKKYDAIVVGAGIGGLATAVTLAKEQNLKVLVLDKHNKPGGQTHTFARMGKYNFDVSFMLMGDMQPNGFSRKLFDYLTDGKVTWAKLNEGNHQFEYPNFTISPKEGKEALIAQLSELFPKESDNIKRFLKSAKKASFGLTSQVIREIIPPFASSVMRLFSGSSVELSKLTLAQALDQHFTDNSLKVFFTSWSMEYGLPPNLASFGVFGLIFNYYLRGVYVPEQGTDALAKTMREIIEAAGGAFIGYANVDEFVVSGSKVVGVKGNIVKPTATTPFYFEAPMYFSAVGLPVTYLNLLPQALSDLERDQLKKQITGHSSVGIYLGLKKSPAEMGFDKVSYLLANTTDYNKMYNSEEELLAGEKPGMAFLVFPGNKYPDKENNVATIMAPFNYQFLEKYADETPKKRSAEYQELKKNIAKALLAMVDERYPGFSAEIEIMEIGTPLTFVYYVGHTKGMYYSLPQTPNRYNQFFGSKTKYQNLYISGTDALSFGLMGAGLGGFVAAAQTTKAGMTSVFGKVFGKK